MAHAIDLYISGESAESAESAAEHAGVATNRLRRELKQHGLIRDYRESRALGEPKRRAALLARTTLPVDEIVERYLAGASVNALANDYGVSRNVIELRLKDRGVHLRDVTEANRLMMSRRSPEEHQRNAEAAHRAVRGRKVPFETRCKIALARERKQLTVSPFERRLKGWLREEFGIEATPQRAVGPYNVDLAAHPVAVEVFGGGWHSAGAHAARTPDRTRYILDQGWNLVIVWVDDSRKHPLGIRAAQYVAAFVEESRRDPTLQGEYRVVWGDGHVPTGYKPDIEDLARVPPHN
jgi:hypothetical protein